MDFDENYETTVSHLRIVREAVKHRRLRNLKFDKMRFISPAAALVLASEVDRWNQRNNGRIRANTPTWHDDIKQLLCEMGYFELLKLAKPTFDEASSKSTIFLKFTRADVGNPNAGAVAKQFRIDVEVLVGAVIKRHFLFEGLSEAITNVGQHAYRVGTVTRQWWLSASFDQKERSLSVIFYDHGVGIPETLPTARFFEDIKDFFNTWRDSQKIEAAMRGGRSVTEKIERGKGLRNYLELPSAYPRGRLSIYSLRGMYRMSWLNGVEAAATRKDYESSIGGTLIEWWVKL